MGKIFALLCVALTQAIGTPVQAQARTSAGLNLGNVPSQIAGGEGHDTAGVLKLIGEFQGALYVGDARALADLFAQDADFTNWRDRAMHGRENIYRHHVEVFKNRPATRTVNLLFYSVRFIAPDVATSEIRWDNKHAPGPEGTTLPNRDGVWVSVMTRESGQWYFKVVRNVMLNDGSQPKPEAPDSN